MKRFFVSFFLKKRKDLNYVRKKAAKGLIDKLKINSLCAANFRNLSNICFNPCPGVNIIYGDNAQGKTNLLEAIWLFTGARSFRGAKEKDQIQKEQDYFALDMNFFSQQREQNSSIKFNGKKSIELNEIKKESASAFAGVFCAVIFSPDHMSLVKQGPEERRRMLDISLSQAYPKYSKALENYLRALKQRNTLLKDIPNHYELIDMLDIWDRHIADYGGYICALRARYVRKLEQYSQKIYSGISSGKESFAISYVPGISGADALFETESFRAAIALDIKNSREADIRLGVTGIGPHRDDLNIQINGMSAKTFGSQGQQRSSILAIKLAECEILTEQNSEPPVVMLDDVMSELDEGRRNYLLNHLNDKQVIITCCDIAAFSAMQKGSIYKMESGILTKQS